MNDKARTRTPKAHPYRITIVDPDPALDPLEQFLPRTTFMVEANSSREARSWFMNNLVRVDEASAREVHEAGTENIPFYDANIPIDLPGSDEGAQDQLGLSDSASAD